ncbi:U1 small nuclear ribonucleoprotein 70kDa [Fistulifera solaris]|uniref:U1 small nuclear ribonucleoprotein 70kDa n=1 Tax=Fistulifera solaris TaxID=1519565 RepID=A0A1Z5K401_FISSO|nr:U1 small nuclear ribonucleoprotein 70kDa [Fistulifera solaris]|eukprot:GAX20980.1 U1 small nuclear ribonucleoprotein 70kDa [Fistulifera solaris]
MRKSTPAGQMTRGANSGPAIMLMPPHIRSTFMPNPPLKPIPPLTKRRKQEWQGMTAYLKHFETTPPPERIVQPTPKSLREERRKKQKEQVENELAPKIEDYRKQQKASGGEFQGMNCYNTLFVGRLAYEVTERKLLREMETFGPVKDIKIVKDQEGKSRGYAFVEYEHEEDMKRAYRAADAMRIEGREIVADVERGHTVPSWLPRRLGGGLGGTRLGGKDVNVTFPGRFDPARPEASQPVAPMGGMGRGGGGPPPPPHLGYGGGPPGPGRGRGFRDGPPPPPRFGMGRGGPPPPDRYGGPPPDRYGGPPNDRKRPRDFPDRDGGRFDRRDRRY